ncbi:hypothetical protein [Agromyces sp. NPDC058110]|uniref:hypothetical protein n=1 Tax=Agromyces sp. NPDC058110 TaxID=3346345 RepID=UPI0036DC436C
MARAAGPVATVSLLIQDDTVDLGAIAGQRVPVRETRELALPADANDRFLDGPACRRLAVVDFDPDTGQPLPPPVAFEPRTAGSLDGAFAFDEAEPDSPAAIAVNAFGIAFRTIRMFEGVDALGRRVRWAFDSEQLLVVPRAGEQANAAYDRRTRSLQFSWFTGASGERVYTALSRDIVAHECGHALLDAVQPSLVDRPTREAVAIHEAVADVVAVLMALESDRLRSSVLARGGLRLDGPTAFSAIAEEFGVAKPGPGGEPRHALRELANDVTLASLAGAAPHELSTLLSAIYFDTLRGIFDERFAKELLPRRDGGRRRTPVQAANRALGTAHLVFRRFVLRGIDYLPPGDLGFADVARAAIAADAAIDGATGRPVPTSVRRRRDAFAGRFVVRGIAVTAAQLRARRSRALDLDPAQLEALRDADFAAYAWVGAHRRAIGIPAGVPFSVLPRIDATKRVGPEGVDPQRELLVKVAWDRQGERRPDGTRARAVPVGATIAIRWRDGRCLALVRSVAAEGGLRGAAGHAATVEGPDAAAPGVGTVAPAAVHPVAADDDGPDDLGSDDFAPGVLGADAHGPRGIAGGRLGSPPALVASAARRAPLTAPPPGVEPGAFFDLVRARGALRPR